MPFHLSLRTNFWTYASGTADLRVLFDEICKARRQFAERGKGVRSVKNRVDRALGFEIFAFLMVTLLHR